MKNASNYETTIDIRTENGTIYGGGIQNEYFGTDLFVYNIFCLYNINGNKENEFIVQLSDRTSIQTN